MLLNIRKRAGLALASLVTPALMWAQVSLYSYSESVETYTEISDVDGGYGFGVATWWPPLHNLRAWANNAFFEPDGQVTNGGYLSPAIGPGYPIGFDFRYNGDVFDRIGVAHGGWISFGKSSDGNRSVVIFTSDHSAGRPLSHSYWQPAPSTNRPDHEYQRNRIAGWGNSNLYMRDHTPQVPPGTVSSLRMATIGTAPNRVCVIQWKDFLTGYPPRESRINFQIRLYETTNVVDVRFGPTVWSDVSGEVQIGLGGRTAEDFNNRKTVYQEPAFLYDWNTTVAGATNTDHCYAVSAQPGQPNGSGIKPEEGRTFRWTPDACPPPAWPVTVSDVSFQGALVTWEPTGAEAYEYFVSDVNSISGPEIASDITPDAEAAIEGLEPATVYYVFVRGICDGEPGIWSLGTPFTSKGGGVVLCDGTTMQENYCSYQNQVVEWMYVSDDGSPLRIEFQSGFVGNQSLQAWDGPTPSGAAGYTGTGNITGTHFQAASGVMFIRLTTDNGACHAQDWYLPVQWRIGCRNCTDPLVTFAVVEDCPNQQYSVEVDIFNLGSSASVRLDNDQGVPPIIVSTTGVHIAGPFAAGTSVVVTVQNPGEPMCYTASPVLLNLPCSLVDCGPTTYTYCYGDNEWTQSAYQGEGTQEIGIRFLGGTVGFGDVVKVYNGADPAMASSQNLGTVLNALFTSGTPSTDRTLVLEVVSNDSHSCADEDPLFGTSLPLEYVVACYDGCTQPRATFATVCVDQTHFNVDVTISEVGSTGSVSITNDGGVANTTATVAGTYTVGPFTSGTPVKFDVVGASVLCTWTSNPLDRNCVGIGIEEAAMRTLALFPNPNDGRFTLELPEEMNGTSELQVLDLAGRAVAQQQFTGTSIHQVDLTNLPNGLYTLVLHNNGHLFSGKVSIQH